MTQDNSSRSKKDGKTYMKSIEQLIPYNQIAKQSYAVEKYANIMDNNR